MLFKAAKLTAKSNRQPYAAGRWTPVACAAAAVVAVGAIAISVLDMGPLSAHMAAHIAAMNVAAPLLAIVTVAIDAARRPRSDGGARGGVDRLWLAAAAQLTLLWAWHVPSLQSWAMSSSLRLICMHGSLLVAAFYFWVTILDLSAQRRWQAIFALLVTGKLACLLASLLTFSPRLLYQPSAEHVGHAAHAGLTYALEDQHLAGLLMILACPLSYLLAGVGVATQILRDVRHRPGMSADRHLPSPIRP